MLQRFGFAVIVGLVCLIPGCSTQMPAEPPVASQVESPKAKDFQPSPVEASPAATGSQAAAGKATMVSEQRLMSLEDTKQRIVHNSRNALHVAWSELYNDGKQVTVPCKTCPGAKKNEEDPNAPEPNINGDWYVRIDGQLRPRHDGIGDMAFSPDGNHIAYAAKEGSKYYLNSRW